MKDLFFNRLVNLKDEAIVFIISTITKGKKSGGIDVEINPVDNFQIDRIEYDSAGLFIRLNKKATKIEELNKETVIMIASYLDESWDGK